MSALAPTLQAFFTDRLIGQRQASPHTIAAYRDTLRLLLAFAAQRTGKQPSSARPRRPRRAADRRVPRPPRTRARQQRPHPQRPPGRDPLAVSLRRAAPPRARRLIAARARDPAQALRARADHVPDRTRDRRAARRARPQHLDRPPRPRAAAARRPDRAARLRADRPHLRRRPPRHRRARQLPRQGPQATHHPADQARPSRSCATWLAERAGHPDEPLFPTRRGRPLSRDALERRLAKHAATAAAACPSLATKTITPHVLRHTAAMRLLHAGVDTSVIALWLGHEQSRDHPDLPARRPRPQGTSARSDEPARSTPGRYRPPDTLLAFLETL